MVADFSDFEATLLPGEQMFACVAVDGFFASERSMVLASPHVGLSNQRYIIYTKRGMMKKRYAEAGSWPLIEFTPRMSSNEGSALGPFLYMLTLFTNGDETVSAGFKTAGQRDDFKETVNRAFENAFQ